jgi:hypothetical protein
MKPLAHYRLWKARTVPSIALVWAFGVGVALAVPATIWSGLGQREVVRIVRAGPEPKARGLTAPLRQSLEDLARWSRPSASSAAVDTLLGAQAAAAAVFAAACAPVEVVQALEQQLAAQRTVVGARLEVDPFATAAFQRLATRSAEAAPCVAGALERAAPAERVQLVRLLARLATSSGSDAAKAALGREAVRKVDATSVEASAPVYALHGYLAVEKDLTAAGDLVQRTVRAHEDPQLRSALREVASRKFAALVPSEALL